ncbi:DUF2809 domain-containing protein [Agromyces protaetiae]|uniref:ribosomal maturation YjgA family protein n=1 Tax=Agromyces protaetiae TaxID=2509455 RepID=UPI0013EAB9B2|nr:DUF2809 domain-containing protein [Agromyces protaetiae]
MRLRAAACAVGCLVLGLALQVLDRSVAVDVAGSVLYVLLVGFIVVVAAPRPPPLAVAAIGFAVAALVELAQLTSIPAAIVDAVPVARLVFGSSFDPLDLVAYAAGALLLWPLARAIGSGGERTRGTTPQKISTPAR